MTLKNIIKALAIVGIVGAIVFFSYFELELETEIDLNWITYLIAI